MSKKQTPRNCGTCVHARFRMTRHKPPRVHPSWAGVCAHPPITVPASSVPVATQGTLHRTFIFPANGTDCPAYSAGKPQELAFGQQRPLALLVVAE